MRRTASVPGAAVDIRVPKEHLWLAPGFYTALSDAAVDVESARAVLRVYWNVTPAGAPALMRALTTRLNAGGVPFRLKIADHPFRLDRCDAAVLYLPGASLEAVRATLLEVGGRAGAAPAAAIPAFTLELAPGVGLAEHDGGAASFGTVRCRLLAEAIVRAHRAGVRSSSERIAVVAERFAEDGVAIEPRTASHHSPAAMSSDGAFLAAASAIGRRDRRRRRVARRAMHLDGRDRRPEAAMAAQVPCPRSTGVRGHGGRRPLPGAARHRHRRGFSAPDRGGSAPPRSRARTLAAGRRSRRAVRGRRRRRAGGGPRVRVARRARARGGRPRSAGRRRPARRAPPLPGCHDREAPARSSGLVARRGVRRPRSRASVPSWRATSSSPGDGHGHGWSWAIPGVGAPAPRVRPRPRRGRASAGHCSSCAPRQATSAFAPVRPEHSRTSGRGSMPTAGTWPDLRVAGQRRGRPAGGRLDDDRHVVPWRGGHRADAITRRRAVRRGGRAP